MQQELSVQRGLCPGSGNELTEFHRLYYDVIEYLMSLNTALNCWKAQENVFKLKQYYIFIFII